MEAIEVWKPVGKCANCGRTEYGLFLRVPIEEQAAPVEKRVMERRCDGGCTGDEVLAAENRET